MITAKRLYLYGVLGVSLVPLLLGLNVLLRLILEPLTEVVGLHALAGSSLAREELSWALAMVVVAAPIWALHAWLLRRTMQVSPVAEAEERASDARATYFFVVLTVTLAAAGWNLFESVRDLSQLVLVGETPWDLPASLAGVAVAGMAWLAHLWARAGDLRVVPDRTAHDWLTRLYLYGALFVILALGLVAAGNVLTTLTREALGLTPIWESADWWKTSLAGPLAAVIVATTGWMIHWLLAGRLMRAAPPMGEAHRRSRARTGYFLASVTLCATAVLLAGTLGLRHLFAASVGAWTSSDGSQLLADVGGPLVMVLPFLGAWWWHSHRAAIEAFVVGGPAHGRAVVRAGRYTVAFVGLVGAAVGVAWVIRALLDLIDLASPRQFMIDALIRDDAAPAVALALLGLGLWVPSWILARRERIEASLEVASATSRRTYLLLVSGLALVATMISLAYLVYQAVRALLEAGALGDTAWAIATFVVASVVLLYHLVTLRADMRLVAASAPVSAAEAEASRPTDARLGVEAVMGVAVETLELRGPVGADFEALNASIRSRLPEGYSLRVVGAGTSTATAG